MTIEQQYNLTSLVINQEDQISQSDFFSDDIDAWVELVNKIRQEVLGSEYELSVNWVAKNTITDLNNTWRQKPDATDVLSFPYSETEGEIFLCAEVITDRHELYDRPLGNFALFLVVHALHHLAGYKHGDAMEAAEKLVRARFNI